MKKLLNELNFYSLAKIKKVNANLIKLYDIILILQKYKLSLFVTAVIK